MFLVVYLVPFRQNLLQIFHFQLLKVNSAEVNLFFLLETILGPLWVWIVIKEQPTIETIIGGSIIILTIATHSFFALKKT